MSFCTDWSLSKKIRRLPRSQQLALKPHLLRVTFFFNRLERPSKRPHPGNKALHQSALLQYMSLQIQLSGKDLSSTTWYVCSPISLQTRLVLINVSTDRAHLLYSPFSALNLFQEVIQDIQSRCLPVLLSPRSTWVTALETLVDSLTKWIVSRSRTQSNYRLPPSSSI